MNHGTSTTLSATVTAPRGIIDWVASCGLFLLVFIALVIGALCKRYCGCYYQYTALKSGSSRSSSSRLTDLPDVEKNEPNSAGGLETYKVTKTGITGCEREGLLFIQRLVWYSTLKGPGKQASNGVKWTILGNSPCLFTLHVQI